MLLIQFEVQVLVKIVYKRAINKCKKLSLKVIFIGFIYINKFLYQQYGLILNLNLYNCRNRLKANQPFYLLSNRKICPLNKTHPKMNYNNNYNNKNTIAFSLYPNSNKDSTIHPSPNQTLYRKKSSRSAYNVNQLHHRHHQQQYQEGVSPMNYKLINPSLSLAMSSVSNIHQQDNQNEVEPTYSTLSHQIFGVESNNKENFNNMNYEKDGIHNDFYKYLMEENTQKGRDNFYLEDSNNSTFKRKENNVQQGLKNKNNPVNNKYSDKSTIQKSLTNRTDIESFHQRKNHLPSFSKRTQLPPSHIHQQNDYILNCPSNQQPSFCSAEQSLHHIQQSQQQLSFIKFKLQEAYQKLQKQILNSYQLQERIQSLNSELMGKNQLIELQKKENQKLKFTLKAIMMNKSFLEEEIEKGEKRQVEKEKQKEENRQVELKDNLKLKMEIKQIKHKYQSQIQLLNKQSLLKNNQLQQLTIKIQKLKQQITKKDEYLQNFAQQLQNFDQIKQENKSFLVKQTQYLNKINVLQSQIRKITDEKITTVNRLKHEIALLQQQNGQLINENQDLGLNQVYMMPMQNFSPYSTGLIPRKVLSKSVSKYSVVKNQQNMIGNSNNNHTPKTPVMFDTEVQSMRQICQFQHPCHQQAFNQLGLDSLNCENNLILHKNVQEQQKVSNKQNMPTQNQQNSIVKNSETPFEENKTVGKWKRGQSVSGNSSTYFQSSSFEQNSKPIQQIRTQMRQPNTNISHSNHLISPIEQRIQKKPKTHNNNILQHNLTPPNDSQDQKLTKYQLHRKNLQSQLSKLQKIKRPTKQQRQKMEKFEKQLYYIDSDIAGLKRKIRRKY